MMWFISNNSKAVFSLFTGLCLLLCFTVGCKDETPPAKPAVVVKRIEQTPRKAEPAEEAEKKADATAKDEVTPPQAVPKPVEAEAEPQQKASETETARSTQPKIETAIDQAAGMETKTDQTAGAEATAASDQPGETERESLKSTLLDTTPQYNPAGKIDPFVALFSEESAATESEDTEPKRPLTPLEKIDLSQLKLVAVLQMPGGNKAMVEDATGKGYVLASGTYIGINSGKVTEILKDRVVVEEKTKDFLGKVSTSKRELKLQKPFGEE